MIIAITFGALAFPMVWLSFAWISNLLADRLLAEVLAKTKTSIDSPRLKPECIFTVNVEKTHVTCSRSDGTTEFVNWDDLQRVEVLTTDDGPFAPDMFWVLYGSTDGCVIPWGATGENELLIRLQALPGFRNDLMVDATTLTTNTQLLCWERPLGAVLNDKS